jgi:hypothetical protein
MERILVMTMLPEWMLISLLFFGSSADQGQATFQLSHNADCGAVALFRGSVMFDNVDGKERIRITVQQLFPPSRDARRQYPQELLLDFSEKRLYRFNSGDMTYVSEPLTGTLKELMKKQFGLAEDNPNSIVAAEISEGIVTTYSENEGIVLNRVRAANRRNLTLFARTSVEGRSVTSTSVFFRPQKVGPDASAFTIPKGYEKAKHDG